MVLWLRDFWQTAPQKKMKERKKEQTNRGYQWLFAASSVCLELHLIHEFCNPNLSKAHVLRSNQTRPNSNIGLNVRFLGLLTCVKDTHPSGAASKHRRKTSPMALPTFRFAETGLSKLNPGQKSTTFSELNGKLYQTN